MLVACLVCARFEIGSLRCEIANLPLGALVSARSFHDLATEWTHRMLDGHDRLGGTTSMNVAVLLKLVRSTRFLGIPT